MTRRPSLLAYILREWGRHTARAWELWPELFWMNILVAAVNAMSAGVICYASPESIGATVPVLSMSTVILTTGVIAGIVQRRRMRKEVDTVNIPTARSDDE